MKKYFINTLGCFKNNIDSDIIRANLNKNNYLEVDSPEFADILIIVTCGFIQSAVEENIDLILDLADIKNNNKILIVTGCLVNRFKDNLIESLPEVDFFIGCNDINDIHNIINKKIKFKISDKSPSDNFYNILTKKKYLNNKNFSCFIKIAEGCNKKCTFCTIPSIKGKFKSRKKKSIITEINKLLKAGAKEINIVSQDTLYYGKDDDDTRGLINLLESITKLPGDFFIRLLYLNPEEISLDLIKYIVDNNKIVNYFDIPIQHSEKSVLKRMGRKNYDKNKIEKIVGYIRKNSELSTIRTTIITGFPGETSKEFNSLLNFIEKIKFDFLGVFKYSNEDDTPAFKLKPKISDKTVSKRYNKIFEIQRQITAEQNKKFLNKKFRVFIEGSDNGIYIGRIKYQAPEIDGFTIIDSDKKLKIGSTYNIKIIQNSDYDLFGKQH